jgi:hypothetical protein
MALSLMDPQETVSPRRQFHVAEGMVRSSRLINHWDKLIDHRQTGRQYCSALSRSDDIYCSAKVSNSMTH